LGLLIPLSIILIVYGVAIEESIARLFVAGVFPGILLVFLFMGYIVFWFLFNKDRMPHAEPRTPMWQRIKGTRSLLPILFLIGGIIGSIYAGWASPTDAAAVGVVLSMVLSWYNGSLNLRSFLAADLLHDCLYSGWRRILDCSHGFYRYSTGLGSVGRLIGIES